jgi:hypothetical protein
MEESGSEGLDALVQRESKHGGWFDGVDAVCIVRAAIYIYLIIAKSS